MEDWSVNRVGRVLGAPEPTRDNAPLDNQLPTKGVTVAQQGVSMMGDIKENGYIRWKGFLITMGSNFLTTMGIVFAMFLYLDSKIFSKAEFAQFEKRFSESMVQLKADIRSIRK